MKRTIILFDMDGVLLHADGYHRALQAAVALIGRNLGIEKPDLTREHIAMLEVGGITHEWESVAICTAILLTHVWKVDPTVRIPGAITPAPEESILCNEDHFSDFLRSVDLQGELPTRYGERVLLKQEADLDCQQRTYLQTILHNAHDHFTSLTRPVFQEYVLGSETFAQMYNRPGSLNTESYLKVYDRPALSQNNHNQLLKWLAADNHSAVIVTNRPSLAPAGYFSTPEAELGTAAIGLQYLPVIGAGSMAWLAKTENLPLQTYYKPSPVHALAGMLLGLGISHSKALIAALEFHKGAYLGDEWQQLDGSTIVVFDDLITGLTSAKIAQELLSRGGIDVEMTLIGVSNHPLKGKALADIAHYLTEDLNEKYLPAIIG